MKNIFRRNGIFYFRARLKSGKELKRSLNTRSIGAARKKARLYAGVLENLRLMSESDDLLKQLKGLGINPDNLMHLIIKNGRISNDGFSFDEMHVDADNPNEVQAAERLVNYNANQNLNPTSSKHTVAPKSSSIKLSEAVDRYSSAKTLAGEWSSKTIDEYRQLYDFLIKLVGDKPVAQITRDDARNVQVTLKQLPPSINKTKKYKGLTVEEIIKLGDEPRSVDTFNKQMIRFSSLFNFLVNEQLIDKNPFKALAVKPKTNDKKKRRRYTDDELVNLFTRLPREENHLHWIPVIALFTGMRLEEICVLHSEDIKTFEEGNEHIHVIHSHRVKKTEDAERYVPVTKELIDFGFLEFVATSQNGRLFKSLKPNKYDKYSRKFSNWFDNTRKELGYYKLTPKLDFHSLRTTLATRLNREGVLEIHTAAILGHKAGETESYKRYADEYSSFQDIYILAQQLSRLHYSEKISESIRTLLG